MRRTRVRRQALIGLAPSPWSTTRPRARASVRKAPSLVACIAPGERVRGSEEVLRLLLFEQGFSLGKETR